MNASLVVTDAQHNTVIIWLIKQTSKKKIQTAEQRNIQKESAKKKLLKLNKDKNNKTKTIEAEKQLNNQRQRVTTNKRKQQQSNINQQDDGPWCTHLG